MTPTKIFIAATTILVLITTLFMCSCTPADIVPIDAAINDGSGLMDVRSMDSSINQPRDASEANDAAADPPLGHIDANQSIVEANVEAPSDNCAPPAGWLLQAAICPSDGSCGLCRVSDPENREAGIGVPISGCFYRFSGTSQSTRIYCADVDCQHCLGDR
jgi:hypothetical protein